MVNLNLNVANGMHSHYPLFFVLPPTLAREKMHIALDFRCRKSFNAAFRHVEWRFKHLLAICKKTCRGAVEFDLASILAERRKLEKLMISTPHPWHPWHQCFIMIFIAIDVPSFVQVHAVTVTVLLSRWLGDEKTGLALRWQDDVAMVRHFLFRPSQRARHLGSGGNMLYCFNRRMLGNEVHKKGVSFFKTAC